jgi:hypothetical protein
VGQRWTNDFAHDLACFERRYAELPDKAREYWPAAFASRAELCTCGLHPDAPITRPEHADDRRELEEWLDGSTSSDDESVAKLDDASRLSHD